MSSSELPRGRLIVVLLGAVALGVASRRLHLRNLLWDKTMGDVLYAIAVYVAIAFLLPRARVGTLIVLAFGVCFGIELFQLTNIPLELARTHPWVHWILGRTFGWHDVACYVVGVAIAAAITARPIARAS